MDKCYNRNIFELSFWKGYGKAHFLDFENDLDCFSRYPIESKADAVKRGLELYESGSLQWTTRSGAEPNDEERYFLNWLPSCLMRVDDKLNAARVLSDYSFLMKRLRYGGNVKRVIQDYACFGESLKDVSDAIKAYCDIICKNYFLLNSEDEYNPAYKIMLQIAVDAADECPVTQDAQRWLNPPNGDSPCNWFWISKVQRNKEYSIGDCSFPCNKTEVIKQTNHWSNEHIRPIFVKKLNSGEILSKRKRDKLKFWSPEDGSVSAELHLEFSPLDSIQLKSGDFFSWCEDGYFRIWSIKSGRCLASFYEDIRFKDIIEGWVYGAKELSSGDIVTWYGGFHNIDFNLYVWSRQKNREKAVLKGHQSNIVSVRELQSGDVLSLDADDCLRIWSPENGVCKELITQKDEQFQTYYSLFDAPPASPFSSMEIDYGMELKYQEKRLAVWNCFPIYGSLVIEPARIFVRDSEDNEVFLRLNYGSCLGISFDQARQFLDGEITESDLTPFVYDITNSTIDLGTDSGKQIVIHDVNTNAPNGYLRLLFFILLFVLVAFLAFYTVKQFV